MSSTKARTEVERMVQLLKENRDTVEITKDGRVRLDLNSEKTRARLQEVAKKFHIIKSKTTAE